MHVPAMKRCVRSAPCSNVNCSLRWNSGSGGEILFMVAGEICKMLPPRLPLDPAVSDGKCQVAEQSGPTNQRYVAGLYGTQRCGTEVRTLAFKTASSRRSACLALRRA